MTIARGDMRHSGSNFAGGNLQCSANDGGSSIEPKIIEERGNPVANGGGGRFIFVLNK